MTDAEKLQSLEQENTRLTEENRKLHGVIERLNHTLSLLIDRYIGEEKIA